MRRLFVLIVLGCSFSITQAQILVKEYFTQDDKPATETNSFYYRVGKKNVVWRGETKKWLDTIFIDTVKTFYTDKNSIRSREIYRDGNREGSYNFYHENGRLKEKGSYKKDQKVGFVIHWTDAGMTKQVLQHFYRERVSREDTFRIINYWNESGVQIVKDGGGYCSCRFAVNEPLEVGRVVNGYRDSTWQVNSGDTIISVERYNGGVFLGGESLYKNSRYSYKGKFEQAEFPNGISSMMSFLSKTIRYPGGSKRMGEQGKVFVKFNVQADGKISDLTILKGVSKDLDKESIRVI